MSDDWRDLPSVREELWMRPYYDASNNEANPRTSCRELRASAGMDELVEDFGHGVVIVRAIDGIHAGCFILWRGDTCAAIGSEQWVRSRLAVEIA